MKHIFKLMPIIFVLSFVLSQQAVAQDVAGVRLSVFGGVTVADIGGDTEPGLALGFTIVPNRKLKPGPMSWRLSAEYNQKRGSGHVSDIDLNDGNPLYNGPGTVTLHYIQISVGGQFHLQSAGVEFCPYLTVGPAFLLGQNVNIVSAPEEGDGVGFNRYQSVDILGLAGVEIRFARYLVDFQFSNGFLTLNKPVPSGANQVAEPLTEPGSHSRSARLGVGLSF